MYYRIPCLLFLCYVLGGLTLYASRLIQENTWFLAPLLLTFIVPISWFSGPFGLMPASMPASTSFPLYPFSNKCGKPENWVFMIVKTWNKNIQCAPSSVWRHAVTKMVPGPELCTWWQIEGYCDLAFEEQKATYSHTLISIEKLLFTLEFQVTYVRHRSLGISFRLTPVQWHSSAQLGAETGWGHRGPGLMGPGCY